MENVNRVVNRYRPFYSPRSGVALSKPRFVLEGDGLRLLPNPVSGPGQLDDEQVAALDVTDDLAREANRAGADSLFARNGHYSRRGNQAIGTALAQRLPRLTAATCGV